MSEDLIAQAEWMEETTGSSLETLLTESPELFNTLAEEWRQSHPMEEWT